MAEFWDRNTAGYEGETIAPNPHDRVQLGGVVLPGVCKVTAAPQIQVDRQKVADFDGATLITRGYQPGPINIECLVWTPEQWAALEAAIKLLWRRPHKIASADRGASLSKAGKVQRERELREQAAIAKASALALVHPNAQLLGIASVIIEGVSLPEPGPVAGSRVVHWKCIEYVESPAKPKKSSAKIAGSKTDKSQIHPEYDGIARRNAPPPPSKTDAAEPKNRPPKASGAY